MKPVILLLYVFISLPVFSQWTVFTQTNTQGMYSNSMVSSIIEVGNYIWYSTEKGLIRYDNSTGQWMSIDADDGIGANFVNKVRPYTQNFVMAATNGGGLSIQTSSSWTTYNTGNGMESQIVYDAMMVSGNLWVATYGGGVGLRTNQGNWHFYGTDSGLVTNNFTCIYRDNQSRMWFGTFDSGVYMLQNGVWTHISVTDGLSSNFVAGINSDDQDRIWFATSQGVSCWDNGTIDVFNSANGLTDGIVYQIYRNSDNHLYFATDEGVYEWYNGLVSHITTTDGLKSDKVISLLKSSAGKWYYGHNGEGLSVLNAGNWEYYDTQTGLKTNYITDGVCLSDGSVWLATGNGVSRYSGLQWKTWTTVNGLPFSYFTHLAKDSFDSLYFKPYYESSLLKFNGNAFSEIEGAPTVERDFEISSDNEIWISANGQVYSYNGVQETIYNTGGFETYNGDIACDTAGKVYILNYNGIYCRNNGSWSVIPYPENTDGYYNTYYSSVCTSNSGVLYLYCQPLEQIFRYDNGNWTNISQGFYWDGVSAMITDVNGMLIVAGINYANSYKANIFTFNGTWQQYEITGFQYYNIYEIFTDLSDNLWVCTNNGVAFAPIVELGVSEALSSGNGRVQVYPNPASDNVSVVSDIDARSEVTISIYTNIGCLMRTDVVASDEWNSGVVVLPVANLVPGIYLLQMDVDGVRINSTIVKQ